MSNKQTDVFYGNAAKYVSDTLVKDPEDVLKIINEMHPEAKKAAATPQCKASFATWASCVQKNGENREACKLDAAKWLDCTLSTFEKDYSIPAARIYHHCFDSLSKFNQCQAETPGKCQELEKSLRDCAAASKNKSLPGL